MEKFTIYREEADAFTAVSNRFIDEYMTEANDAQLKVYLYLLRTFQANQATGISDMADLFNHTEKDIIRALKYWEKKGLLVLGYDSAKNISSLRLLTPGCKSDDTDAASSASLSAGTALSAAKALRTEAVPAVQSADIVPLPATRMQAQPEKPSYSLDDLKAFRSNEETAQLLFIVEQYIGKPLTPGEMKTVLFLYDKLGFSADLIDYLVQYCVDKGKRSFRYIETIALNWAEAGIKTPEQAKATAYQYDKTVYAVMKALGKSNSPTPKEVSYITRWTKEFGFSMQIIETACERTVMATDKHRFEYADSILSHWNRAQVHTIDDIKTADSAYQKTKNAQPAASNTGHQSRPASWNNQFNQFPQREYDFEALEKELLSN